MSKHNMLISVVIVALVFLYFGCVVITASFNIFMWDDITRFSAGLTILLLGFLSCSALWIGISNDN